jgi:hypothetical protein
MHRCLRRLAPLPAALFCTLVHAVPEGPDYPSPEWGQRELANYAKVGEAPLEQAGNPVFLQRQVEQGLTNQQSWLARIAADPSWFGPPSGNTLVTPLCSTWTFQCTGDPFRYPEAAGADGAPFYTDEAEVIPVVFYDRGCARISGRVWAPRNGRNGLPAVVIENGSVQAPEPLYWWAAQALVRAGYGVMTFDPRGQGRSDQQTPDGEQGSNANPVVFWEGLVDAIDFFRSSSVQPYPHNESCAGSYPTEVTAFNPHIARIDPTRLGIVGHSLGATGVSVVQGYGAPGAEPWPGLMDTTNPVDVAVGWDSLRAGASMNSPPAVPRVPAMGHSSEYGLVPVPFQQPPDPESHKGAFVAWRDADLPVFQLSIQGSSHYEWSLIPTFPTSSWCKTIEDGRCKPGKDGGWGRPLAEHYTVAWLDRWLKQPGETGYCDADARLLADADWVERYSFYFRSARRFPDRGGTLHHCEDIRAGVQAVPEGLSCSTPAITPGVACSTGGGGGGGNSGTRRSGGGGSLGPLELGLMAALALLTMAARRSSQRAAARAGSKLSARAIGQKYL